LDKTYAPINDLWHSLPRIVNQRTRKPFRPDFVDAFHVLPHSNRLVFSCKKGDTSYLVSILADLQWLTHPKKDESAPEPARRTLEFVCNRAQVIRISLAKHILPSPLFFAIHDSPKVVECNANPKQKRQDEYEPEESPRNANAKPAAKEDLIDPPDLLW